MIGLMFHHFHGGAHPKVQGSFSAQELAQVIESRKNLVSAQEFMAWRPYWDRGDQSEVLTFDDGLRCQYDVALPVLQAYRLTAFWFVPTAPLIGVRSRLEIWRWLRTVGYDTIDAFYDAFDRRTGYSTHVMHDPNFLSDRIYLSPRDRAFRFLRDHVLSPHEYERTMESLCDSAPTKFWMTPLQLIGLQKQGHIIGPHSHSHPTMLADLTNEQQEIEYATSSWILEQILGEKPIGMSHPNGQSTPHGIAYLQELGYQIGFNATPKAGSTLLELGRINSADLRP